MHRSLPHAHRYGDLVARPCRTALLIASRTTASAWSASTGSITDSGPSKRTVVRNSPPAYAAIALSSRCRSRMPPAGPCRSKIAVRISVMTVCSSSTDSVSRAAPHRRWPADRAPQGQPHREKPLDHMVMQIPGNSVPVGQDVEFAHLPLGDGELPRQGRLVGEPAIMSRWSSVNGALSTPRRNIRPDNHSVVRSGSTNSWAAQRIGLRSVKARPAGEPCIGSTAGSGIGPPAASMICNSVTSPAVTSSVGTATSSVHR